MVHFLIATESFWNQKGDAANNCTGHNPCAWWSAPTKIQDATFHGKNLPLSRMNNGPLKRQYEAPPRVCSVVVLGYCPQLDPASGPL